MRILPFIALMFMLAGTAAAEEMIVIGNVRYNDYTYPALLPVAVNLQKDDAGSTLATEDVQVRVFIPELGLRASSSKLETLGRQLKRLYSFLFLPEDTSMGEYWMRIQVSDKSNSRRTIHRPLTITKNPVPEVGVEYCPPGNKFCAS